MALEHIDKNETENSVKTKWKQMYILSVSYLWIGGSIIWKGINGGKTKIIKIFKIPKKKKKTDKKAELHKPVSGYKIDGGEDIKLPLRHQQIIDSLSPKGQEENVFNDIINDNNEEDENDESFYKNNNFNQSSNINESENNKISRHDIEEYIDEPKEPAFQHQIKVVAKLVAHELTLDHKGKMHGRDNEDKVDKDTSK